MAQKGYIKNSLTKDLGAPEMANMFQGIFGASGIMSLYENLACVKVDNNTVRMSSGAYNLSGHLLGIAKGTTEDLTIDSGTSGQNRNDLIVAEFVRNGGGLGVDTLHFTVVKGASTSGTAADPALTQQDINAAGVTRQEALYRVKVTGTTLTQIDLLATQLPNLNLVQEKIRFKGALVKTTTSQNLIAASSVTITWNTVVYDTDSFWNALNPSRLTVPANVSRVRLSFQGAIGSDITEIRFYSYKNDNAFDGMIYHREFRSSGITMIESNNIQSAIVDCEEGDYFEIKIFVEGGAGAKQLYGALNNYFAIEVIE